MHARGGGLPHGRSVPVHCGSAQSLHGQRAAGGGGVCKVMLSSMARSIVHFGPAAGRHSDIHRPVPPPCCRSSLRVPSSSSIPTTTGSQHNRRRSIHNTKPQVSDSQRQLQPENGRCSTCSVAPAPPAPLAPQFQHPRRRRCTFSCSRGARAPSPPAAPRPSNPRSSRHSGVSESKHCAEQQRATLSRTTPTSTPQSCALVM